MGLKIKQKRVVKPEPTRPSKAKPQDVVVADNPRHRFDFERLLEDPVIAPMQGARKAR